MMQVSPVKFEKFQAVDEADCQRRIIAAKQKLGSRLVILGHHYQNESVYRHADYTGDSLKLSRYCETLDAEFIVFLGVHFMAEVADILSRQIRLPFCQTLLLAVQWLTWLI
jgi:quinolinate synthase